MKYRVEIDKIMRYQVLIMTQVKKKSKLTENNKDKIKRLKVIIMRYKYEKVKIMRYQIIIMMSWYIMSKLTENNYDTSQNEETESHNYEIQIWQNFKIRRYQVIIIKQIMI